MSAVRPADVAALVLAAGQGTRMNSDLAKVLHPMCGEPMLAHVLAALDETGVDRILVVIGHQRDRVREAFPRPGIEWVVQAEQRGTGHAVQMAAPALGDFSGTLLVVCGDTPLLRGATLRALLAHHAAGGAAATVLSTRVPEPRGYGRIVRDAARGRVAIVEERDAAPKQRSIDEINSGIFAFRYPVLRTVLGRLTTENAQGEYYLTDTLSLIQDAGYPAGALCAEDWRELLGINTPEQLAEVERIHRGRRGGLGPGPGPR